MTINPLRREAESADQGKCGSPKWRKRVGAGLALAVVLGGLVPIVTQDAAHAAAPDSINTVEGGGSSPSFGIPATASSYTPSFVAVDSAGDLFMSIDNDSTFYVAEIPAASGTYFGTAMTAGDIYAIAGNGQPNSFGSLSSGVLATSVPLAGAQGVAVDSAGDVYIASTDSYENGSTSSEVNEIAATTGSQHGIAMTAGYLYTVAGDGTAGFSGDGGPATSAELNLASGDGAGGLAIDSQGDIYITDGANNRIREVPAQSGTQFGISMTANDIYTIIGNGTEGYPSNGTPAPSAELDRPIGVSVDGAGDLFISEYAFDLSGGPSGVLDVPALSQTRYGIAMTAGDIYTVAGQGSDGNFASCSGSATYGLEAQTPVGVDSSGDIFLGSAVDVPGNDTSAEDMVCEVPAVSGTYYGQTMTAGNQYDVAGNGQQGFAGDGGAATAAELDTVLDVAVDNVGDLYLVDSGNGRIRDVNAQGNATITMTGTVTYQSGGQTLPVAGAIVQACSTTTGGCLNSGYSTTTTSDGNFSLTLSSADMYAVSAYPPPFGGYHLIGPSTVQVTAGYNGVTGVDITLQPYTPLPTGTSFGNSTPGQDASVNWGSSNRITTTGCPNGLAISTFTGINFTDGLPDTVIGALAESPPGSGTYVGDVPPLSPIHGAVQSSVYVDCPTSTALAPASGTTSGGNSVQITGGGFSAATAVDFGTTPAESFSVVSDTEIDAVAPPGTGQVPVAIDTPTGVITSQSNAQYSYLDVSGVSPNSGDVSGGQTVTVTGSGFSNAYALYFGNIPVQTWTVESDSQISATVPSALNSGAVDVSVLTSDGGNSGTSPTDGFTYTGSSPHARVSGPNQAANTANTDPKGPPSPHGTPTSLSSSSIAKSIAKALSRSEFGKSLSGANSLAGSNGSGVHANASPAGEEGGAQVTEASTQVLEFVNGVLEKAIARCKDNAPIAAAIMDALKSQIVPLLTTIVQQLAQAALKSAIFGGQAGGGWLSTATLNSAATTIEAEAMYAEGAATFAGVGAFLGYVALGIAIAGLIAVIIEAIKEGDALKGCLQPPAPPSGAKGGGGGGSGKGGSISNPVTFPTKVDPSGTVQDTNGNPIAGATTTLLQSDTQDGPFTAPPSGSPIMDPSINPETTDSTGQFHWDVDAGYYQVQAGSSGCVDPNDPGQSTVSTPTLQVPPPQVGLVLTLSCSGEPPPPVPQVTGLDVQSGPAAGGTLVQIAGTGFAPGAQVAFGGTPASNVTVVSPTSIQATVPSGSGTVDVTVTTTAGGQSAATGADEFTYVVPPAVTGVSPTSGPEAGGTVVAIQGSGFSPGATAAFGTDAAPTTYISPSQLVAEAPSGTGTQDVTVTTSSGGSSTTSSADQFTFTPPGGAISLGKTSSLVGNQLETVSGTGWNANGDSSVAIYQCAIPSYASASCDSANQAGVALETGKKVGQFKKAPITLAVGTIDAMGDTCGLATSRPCYLVVVGNTDDSTSSGILGFTLPSLTLKTTTGVVGNYADSAKAAGVPAGDSVTAQECDTGVSVPATLATHCDAATDITGVATSSGSVTFAPGTIKLLVGSAFSDGANGLCSTGTTCDVVLSDAAHSAVDTIVPVTFASPTATVKKTAGVSDNYVDKVSALAFPAGDTITARECDSSVNPATNLATNCDRSTVITGSSSSSGKVTFSPTGVTVKDGSDYSESGSGTCEPGGTCDVVVNDSTESGVSIVIPIQLAS